MRTMKLMKVVIRLVLVLLSVMLFVPVPVTVAAGPPDTINLYQVTVTPEQDGSLVMKYEFDYLATTDFPQDSAFLEVGVPNKDFTLTEFGPKPFVKKAFTQTSGVSQVRLEFDHLPRKGENFKLNFSIKQGSMAYALGDNVTFTFIPGWFSFAEIKLLRIVWKLPTDASLIGKLSPPPTKQSEGQAIWETTNLAPNAKFPVTIYVAKKAFDSLKAIEAPLQPTPGNPPSSSSGSIQWGEILFWAFVIVLVLIIVIALLAAIGGGGGYSGSIGGHTGGSSIFGDVASGIADTVFGGGGGGFSGGGGGSSGCACACACAGGGRAGCSKRLGFDVSLFLKSLKRQEPKEDGNET